MSKTAVLDNSSIPKMPSVLVVGDSEFIRSSLRAFLEMSGYRVIEAVNKKEGLAAYDRERPDIVLADLEMPQNDGLRFVAELSDAYVNIPVIAISGEGRRPDGVEAVRQWPWGCLTKPVNKEELEVTIRYALERARLLEENARYRERLEKEVLTKTRELRDGRKRYQRLLESVTNYVYTVSFEDGKPTGTVHQHGCEKVTGYTSAEYNATPDLWYRIVHDDDRPQVLDMAQRILTESENLRLEHRIRHKDGSLRWIRNILVPYRDMEGNLVSYDGIISDITERKLADIKLKESEERFSQLFLQQEDAIILFKLDTLEIIDASPTATELFGYGRDELLCTFPWPFVDEGHQELREYLVAALHQNGRFDVFRHPLIRKDGTPVDVSMRGKLVTIMDDKVIYCSIRDITEKIRLEEDVRDTQAKLIQANKMASLGMLTSGIAHEINNPNNFILFNSSLLAETWQAVLEILDDHAAEQGDFYLAGQRFSEVREETPRLIAGLCEGARRIQAIVETLKGFVRQDPDESGMPIDINSTVRMALTLLSHEIRRQNSDIKVDLGSDLPHACGKSQQIEQVVINLVTNALHAVAENDGGIRVATTYDRAGESVIITIQDEGVGMTKEELERVAEPFFTTRSAQGGTGLGVSISRSIVREHHGTLVHVSEPGRGTTVAVRLPISESLPKGVNCSGATA
ncbi:MAG: PAS domain S-box protein [Desulfuromonadaceae bacterium]